MIPSFDSTQWYPDMPYPEAIDPCKNLRETLELEIAMADQDRNFGIATIDDPMTIWLRCIPQERFADKMVEATNDIAVLVAERCKLPYVWVVHEAHNKEYVRDRDVRKVLDPNKQAKPKQLLADTDYHITFRLGTGPYECMLSAHAWVVLDEDGFPSRLATRADRTQEYIRYDDDDGISFWPWKAGVQSDYWYDPLGNTIARRFSPAVPKSVVDICIGRPTPPHIRKERPRCGASDDPCHDCQGRRERDEAYWELVRDAEDQLRHARRRPVVKRHENPNMIVIPDDKLRIRKWVLSRVGDKGKSCRRICIDEGRL